MKTLKHLFIGIIVLGIFNPAFSQDAVMDYTELQQYLPAQIDGYEPGEPGGSSMSMQDMSFSSADIEFNGANGKFIKITLLDYSDAANMYSAATAMWSTDLSFEDDVSKVQTFTLGDEIAGWEEFRKKEKEAQIAMGIGDRFFLSIEANQQSSTDFIKGIAMDMSLEELANQ